jgi:uncharacterized membrane protein SpoIIM required for sporulation
LEPLAIGEINEKNVDFFYVFSSNILLIIKDFGFGVLTFGIYPLATYMQNVLLLGLIGNRLINNNQPLLFYKMIPHGLIEIFGIVLSVTAIFYCFYMVVRIIPAVVKREVKVKDTLIKILSFLCAIMCLELGLFIIAGIVEVFVSWFKVM